MAAETTEREPDTTIGIHDIQLTTEYIYDFLEADDPFVDFLPDYYTADKDIVIGPKALEPSGLVLPGQPNKFQVSEAGKGMTVQPVYFRRGNTLERQSDLELLVAQARAMFTLLKAQTLQGGIHLVDHETGVSIDYGPTASVVNVYDWSELVHTIRERVRGVAKVLASPAIGPRLVNFFNEACTDDDELSLGGICTPGHYNVLSNSVPDFGTRSERQACHSRGFRT